MPPFRPNYLEISFWVMAGCDEEASQPTARAREEEHALIRRAQGGEHDAFETLVRRHQRRVLSLIAHLVRQPAEVEDIAQQVFFKVYLALPRFDFRSAFSTWLYRIAVNECYDHLRRQRAQKSPTRVEVGVEELAKLAQLSKAATQPVPPDIARQTELRQIVEKLFRHLAPKDRLMLVLKELEGFSVEEITAIMGLKESTVKVRLFRARRHMLEAYQRLMAHARRDR